ncbi:MAG: imidazolonepropionase [Deltaproteobacteria bacterium]|nr:imidazolonepropionase [Deltaproteobacteria bacterium]
MIRKLIRNAHFFTPVDNGGPLAGNFQGRVASLEHGAMLIRDGLIERIGTEPDMLTDIDSGRIDEEVDCMGKCVIPGFVDPHTHMCFAARREAEFGLRLKGTSYLDILKAGGGILSSVNAVRKTSEEGLLEATLENALSALRFGTTTLEIKSGYGLNTETELKMLSVIDRVRRLTPLDVVATFMGAHAVPEEYRKAPEDYVDLLINEMIPAVSRQGIARYCDVFCEAGVFSVNQSRRILSAAHSAGFGLKIHADEVHDMGAAGLAAELRAVSAEHLLAASHANIVCMAKSGTIAVLLPGTAYSLQKPYARARDMIAAGVPVAIATDCNPGSCFTESMPFVFGLSVMNMGLTPEEALTAATLNAAYSIGMADRVGSLDPGKQADFLILDGGSPAILAYHAGVLPVEAVFKKGERMNTKRNTR